MTRSRRQFLKECATAAGVVAAGGLLLSHRFGRTASTRRSEPSYIALERDGRLATIERKIWELHDARSCCPRRCDKNRKKEEPRVCGSTDKDLKVSSAAAHFGEERPLVGTHGSGTVFFSNCSLLCCYCQNWEIAHRGDGTFVTHQALAKAMLALQARGCHNINLVTPTHALSHIITSLRMAVEGGLRIPLVYNTGGYDRPDVIRMLDGVVDIYMPDFKYQDSAMAAQHSLGAADYPEIAAAAIKEMHRQASVLQTDAHGLAFRGLILRHLVLPNNISGTDRFVRWVAEELSPDVYVNLMAQYHPQYRAKEEEELARPLTREEWHQAVAWAEKAGLTNLDA